MNIWFFYIILLFLNLRSLTNVSQRNALKIEAGTAFYKKNFPLAAQKYEELANISYNLEPEARLNLAHSYFSINDTSKALEEYKKLVRLNEVPNFVKVFPTDYKRVLMERKKKAEAEKVLA